MKCFICQKNITKKQQCGYSCLDQVEWKHKIYYCRDCNEKLGDKGIDNKIDEIIELKGKSHE